VVNRFREPRSVPALTSSEGGPNGVSLWSLVMAYIYLHRRNDTGAVFYIGKGTGDRATTTKGRNQHWHRVVNKAGFTAEIIVRGLTDDEAYWLEPLLIEAHGGVDKLTNMAEGGLGLTSEDAKRTWKDPELREKISQSIKDAWKDPELREKMSQSTKELWKDPEYREKISKARKEMWQDPTYREKRATFRCEHAEEAENIYTFPNGKRTCRTCFRNKVREWRHRQRDKT